MSVGPESRRGLTECLDAAGSNAAASHFTLPCSDSQALTSRWRRGHSLRPQLAGRGSGIPRQKSAVHLNLPLLGRCAKSFPNGRYGHSITS